MTTDITEQPQTSHGKRKWMYPVIRKGKFYKYRNWLSYVYLVLFLAGPYIRVGGRPLLLLNVMERHFVLQ